MKYSNPVSTPLAGHFMLSKKSCPSIEEEKVEMLIIPYSLIVGSLVYVMMCTCSNISYAVGLMSIFLENLGKPHWEAVK